MIACSINQVTKMYGGHMIFENISLELNEKERVGLVGPNGSGKSTLLKLLAGEELPNQGQIHWKKGSRIGYLAQFSMFQPDISVREALRTAFSELIELEKKIGNLEKSMSQEMDEKDLQKLVEQYGVFQDQYLSKGGYAIDSEIDKVAKGLNIEGMLDQTVGALSGGEKTKAGLAYILLKESDLLLLDEPTNHLDVSAIEWLGNYIKNFTGTVVIVSHDRYFLDETVNRIVHVENGDLESFDTNYSDYVTEKEARLLREFHAYEEQQKKRKKMKETIKRLREWANRAKPPNEGLHKRARNMEKALERMEKLDRPVLNRKKMNLKIDAGSRSGKDVIQLKAVSKAFFDNQLFQDVNLHVQYQQRTAIVGNNGTGKTTLLKLILGHLKADKGEVRIGSNVKIGYLSQHTFSKMVDRTAIDVFRDEVKVTEAEARQILAKFLFYGYSVFKKVSQLSGGEKMRLRLAQLMYQDTNLLILDEPTNHLDIDSLEVLEETLEQYEGTILAISHDRYFLNKLFDRIFWIEDGRVHVWEGNYDWAKQKMSEKRT